MDHPKANLVRLGFGFIKNNALALLLLTKKKKNGQFVNSILQGYMNPIILWTQGLLACGLVFLWGMASPPPSMGETPQVALEVFVKNGCPHCESAKRFLAGIQQGAVEQCTL